MPPRRLAGAQRLQKGVSGLASPGLEGGKQEPASSGDKQARCPSRFSAPAGAALGRWLLTVSSCESPGRCRLPAPWKGRSRGLTPAERDVRLDSGQTASLSPAAFHGGSPHWGYRGAIALHQTDASPLRRSGQRQIRAPEALLCSRSTPCLGRVDLCWLLAVVSRRRPVEPGRG